MSCELAAVSVAALDPERQARFWAALLGWTRDDHTLAREGPGFGLRFEPAASPKTGKNPMHLDLTSTSAEDQQARVEQALALGGRHVDVGQVPEERHVVLADPEGNEFCVIEPGNRFLDGCGLVGALACDGSQAVGYFWRDALGWPLVWDRDQETAIQAAYGETKVSWGGYVEPKVEPDRWHLELAPTAGGDVLTEVARLVDLGARQVGPDDRGGVLLLDPDGNEFRLLDVG